MDRGHAHAALIVRGGKLVYERYFAGEDRAWATPLGRVSYHAGLKHDLRSITKSITSLLVGVAVNRGWIGDLEEPVFSLFPEHRDLRTADKALQAAVAEQPCSQSMAANVLRWVPKAASDACGMRLRRKVLHSLIY